MSRWYDNAVAELERDLEEGFITQAEFRETMWAEMKPDCYGGKHCNELRPRWEAYAEGDKDEDTTDTIDLAASTFPPGTKIVVSEPVCPICDSTPSRSLKQETFHDEDGNEITEYTWTCQCNFDWRTHALNEYS